MARSSAGGEVELLDINKGCVCVKSPAWSCKIPEEYSLLGPAPGLISVLPEASQVVSSDWVPRHLFLKIGCHCCPLSSHWMPLPIADRV